MTGIVCYWHCTNHWGLCGQFLGNQVVLVQYAFFLQARVTKKTDLLHSVIKRKVFIKTNQLLHGGTLDEAHKASPTLGNHSPTCQKGHACVTFGICLTLHEPRGDGSTERSPTKNIIRTFFKIKPF